MGKWAKGMRKIVEWVEAISVVSKNENNKDNNLQNCLSCNSRHSVMILLCKGHSLTHLKLLIPR